MTIKPRPISPSRLVLSICTALALTFILAACQKDKVDYDVPYHISGNRTVLIYMSAQNSLGKHNNQHTDSLEIMKAKSRISDNNRLLLFIDDAQAPRLYIVDRRHERPTLIKQWDTDFCSTDPKHFQEVLQYAFGQFPAKEYGLVLWSHADGWLPATDTDYDQYEPATPAAPAPRPFSFGIDSGPAGQCSDNGAEMNIADMAQAIAATGIKLKYIFFDACLMQNIEVDYALRHVTDYVIGGPMQIPGDGANYTNQVLRGLFTKDPADIARTYLADVKDPMQAASYDDFGLCISCVRTDQLQNVADALKAALPHSTLMNGQSPAMFITNGDDNQPDQPVTNYQAYTEKYYYRPHNYDMRQALQCLLPAIDYQRVITALEKAVTFYGATDKFWIGPGYNDMQTMPTNPADYICVSMFVPQLIYTTNANKKYAKYGDHNQNFRLTEWYTAAGFAQSVW